MASPVSHSVPARNSIAISPLLRLAASLLLCAATVSPAREPPAHRAPILRVTTDFPGGSALIQSIDQDSRTIRLQPNSPVERGWACWWYFKLEGVEVGSTVTLEVGGRGFGLPDQACVSYDNRTWSQTAVGERRGARLIVYRHEAKASTVWFAWGPPFVLQDAVALVDEACRASPFAKKFELARTREGRPVPGVCIAEPGVADEARSAIWIQARQHAWESGASWVGRGLVEWLISNDSAAAELRRRAIVYVIPVMDVDNVEHGFGGKNQQPHDHYWDWGANAVYPEVRAAIERITAMIASGRFAGFFDLHNPDPSEKNILFYVPALPLLVPERVKIQDAFLKIVREETVGPMGFIGKLGPIGATYDPAVDTASDCWIAQHGRPSVISLTMETPWNTPTSTAAGYRKAGEQLGRSIERYLRETPGNK
jgi:hypothetical protein